MPRSESQRITLVLALLASGAAAAAPIVVQLSIANSGCVFDLVLNGVDLTRGETSDVFSSPVNPWLAGKGNTVEVSAKPKPKAEACTLELKVEQMDRATWRTKLLAQGKIDKETAKVSLTFDTATDALGAWKKAEPLKDEKAIRAYALKLVELVRAGNWTAWQAEAKPRYDQVAASFQAPPEALLQSEHTTFGALQRGLKTLKDSDLALEPLLDGRLWRVRWKQHPRALMVAKDGDDELALEIVVGQVDGQLKVVR